jgi:Tfp pilus assembly protein FimT
MRMRANGGFTLFEALVATSISLIVLAIGLPNLARLRAPYALSSATRQIAADLQAARQRAIARNVRYRVTFNGVSESYTIEREQGGAFVADSAPQPLPAGAQLGAVTPGNPVFDTRGMLAADVTVPVTVTGSGTRTVTINVLGKTTIN